MDTLGQALGMAYANQYGGKYALPIFGSQDDDENPISPADLAASLSSQPVGVTPAADTGVMPKPPTATPPTWVDYAAKALNIAANYGSGAGLAIQGLRSVENLLKPVEQQPLTVFNAPAKALYQQAQFGRNFFQGASPMQDAMDAAQLGIQTTEKIFGATPTPPMPKLANFADKAELGSDASGVAQAGAFTGELAGMIASIMTGTTAVKAMEIPALARSVSTIPKIGKWIAWAAPWLGAESLAGAVGAGLGNAAHSFGNDSRDVVEGKEQLGHMLAKTGLQGVAGTFFGGAASPGISLSKKILGELFVNEISGLIPASYDALTGRTTWLPAKTPTAEAIKKLRAAQATGNADAIAIASGEADRTATHTLLGAMNSVLGQATINAIAGAGLPLAAAAFKGIAKTVTGKPPINPVATATGAAPVSEAAAPATADVAINNAIAAKNFVRNTYVTREDIANSGMGASRKEINAAVMAQMDENPAVAQIINDINSGKATVNDYFAATGRDVPPPVVEPVAAEPVITEPIVQQEPVIAEPTAVTPPVGEWEYKQKAAEPIDLTPEVIGRMTDEEIAQHFDVAPAQAVEPIPEPSKISEYTKVYHGIDGYGHNMDNRPIAEPIAAPVPEPVPLAQISPEPAKAKQEYDELMADMRMSRTIGGREYKVPEPMVKTENGQLVSTRPDVIVGNPTTVQLNGEEWPAHYVFHPADLGVPAHKNGVRQWENFIGNPQGKRGQVGIDYEGGMMEDYDAKQMIGKDENAFQNAPSVLLTTGEPIQGNSRIRLVQMLYEPGNEKKLALYRERLDKDAAHYGLDTPEKLAAFNSIKNGTVSRVIDTDRETAVRLSKIHQDDAAFSKSPSDRSILRLSSMTPEAKKKALRAITAGLEGEDGDTKTLLQLLRKEDYRKDMALLLAGPYDQRKMAVYMDNVSNDNGVAAIQSDLRNLVLGEDEDVIRKFDTLQGKYKDAVNANIGSILRLHEDPIFKDIKGAIEGLQKYSVVKEKEGKAYSLNHWLRESDMYGKSHEETHSAGAISLMRLMDENPPSEMKKMFNEYLDIRKNTSGESMFGEEPVPYSTMLDRAMSKVNSGRLLGLAAPAVGSAAGEAGASLFDDDKEYAGIKGSTIKDALRTIGLAAGMIATVHAMGGGKMLKIVTKRGEEVTVQPLPEGTKIVNGFYSPIEKMLRETKQEKNSAGKWLSMIGKGDEAVYTGLRSKLEAMKPTEQISKDDLLAHLDENRIVPVEVVKGKYHPDWVSSEHGYAENFDYETPDKLFRVRQELDGDLVLSQRIGKEYVDVGNYEDYEDVDSMVARLAYLEGADLPIYSRYQLNERLNEAGQQPDDIEGSRDYKEVLVTLLKNEDGKYTHPHWENEKNVLVHIRMSQREFGMSNKLLVEEIQSDWAQAGRKDGFSQPPGSKFTLAKEDDVWNVRDADGRIRASYVGEMNAQTAYNKMVKGGVRGTPRAPFVTSSAAPVKLAAKYILKEAVEQDVDRITWTTGAQQNSRYNLAKQVDEIAYNPTKQELTGGFEDDIIFSERGITPDLLPKYIGKELAERLLKQPVDKGGYYDEGSQAIVDSEWHALSGKDLEIGGNGMRKWYGEPDKGKIGLVGEVMESLFGKGAVKVDEKLGMHYVEMTPEMRASAQAGLSLFNLGGAAMLPDNDEPIYPGSSITNRDARIVLGTLGVAAIASHPTITGMIRKMKISAPETALREIGKVEPVIPGYVGKKLNPSKIADTDLLMLTGKARADGITDELVAHHAAFLQNESYSQKHLDESRASLYGLNPDKEAESAAADYLLKSVLRAHNGNGELPEISDRLHTLILNTIDGADGIVGKNEYVQSNADADPTSSHIATITQGREQALGIPPATYEETASTLKNLDSVHESEGWDEGLYMAATGDDPVLKSAIDKMNKREEQLSPEEVQAWQKYDAEKTVWDKAIEFGTLQNEWKYVAGIRKAFQDPVRADAFDKYISQRAWDVQMDSEVNAIARQNGFEPIPPKPKSGVLYSSILPVSPGAWQFIKNSRIAQTGASTAFGYVSGNMLFDDDKMYGGMTGKEAKLLMAATFGGIVAAKHIGAYLVPKIMPASMRLGVHNLMHREDLVGLNDIENVASKKYAKGTPGYTQEVADMQAKLKEIDKGSWFTSASGKGAIGHKKFNEIRDAQNDSQLTGRAQKREVDILLAKFNKYSDEEKNAAQHAAAEYDKQLGYIRANENLSAEEKAVVREQVKTALDKKLFADNPRAKEAFDVVQEMAGHARQIDVESRLMKKFSVSWDELPTKIEEARNQEAAFKAQVREKQELYATAADPAVKSSIVADIHALNRLRQNFDTFATQLEYMRDLPAESQAYHYLPHYWDKQGNFKYSITSPDGEKLQYLKFDTHKEANDFLKKFNKQKKAGEHNNTASRVGSTGFTQGQRDMRLIINDLIAAGYSEKTGTLASLGLNREKLLQALETLDEWTDMSSKNRNKVVQTLDENITPESLRHILNEMWHPRDVHLEFRKMRSGYLDVDPADYFKGITSKQDQKVIHDWVFGGLDKMITGGRLTLEKSAMLKAATDQLDELGKEGLSSSKYYSWLKDKFIPGLTNPNPIPASRARTVGTARSLLSMSKLALNPLHGAFNVAYGSVATVAEAAAQTGNVLKPLWYFMTSAADLPSGGKWSTPEVRQGIKQLEKYDYGETQFYNQALRSRVGNSRTAKALMMASIKSEEFNNKMASLTFLKTALNRGATVDEAVEYALKNRQTTQFAFTPWMTTKVERQIRNLGGGWGSVGLTLFGAAIRGAEHTASIYYRAAQNPRKAAPAALAMFLATTMIGGLYGDPWVATALKIGELAEYVFGDNDDTKLTKENTPEFYQRKMGDAAESFGLPREKGENLFLAILQGIPANKLNVNFSQDNNLSGLVNPVAYSTGKQIVEAVVSIASDNSMKEKLLDVTKLITPLSRATRAGLSLAEGHRVDNKGNKATDEPYGIGNAFQELTTGTPADVALATKMKFTKGGDLRDQYSKEGYVKAMYNMPHLRIGSEKNPAQFAALAEKAQTIRRGIQTNYEKTSEQRAADLERIVKWARTNSEFVNWIDRNGGADIAGNVTAKAMPALERNIEQWYAAKATAATLNAGLEKPVAHFAPRYDAAKDAMYKLQKSASGKADTPEKKKEIIKLFAKLKPLQ